MNEVEEKQRLVRKVRGVSGLEIEIISQCPKCRLVNGIVGEDKIQINFWPKYIEFVNGDQEKIPEVFCNRQECKCEICKFSDSCPLKPTDLLNNKVDQEKCTFVQDREKYAFEINPRDSVITKLAAINRKR